MLEPPDHLARHDLPNPLTLLGPVIQQLSRKERLSFAAVFGQHIFGGTGRYVASPAALGALFNMPEQLDANHLMIMAAACGAAGETSRAMEAMLNAINLAEAAGDAEHAQLLRQQLMLLLEETQ